MDCLTFLFNLVTEVLMFCLARVSCYDALWRRIVVESFGRRWLQGLVEYVFVGESENVVFLLVS